jgi:hypothetical protein
MRIKKTRIRIKQIETQEQIQNTTNRIEKKNELVYGLYGLSEEEIKIVEEI